MPAAQLHEGFLALPALKRFAVLGFAATTVIVILFIDVPGITQMRTWSDGAGNWFPILFLAGYILITQFPIPRTLLTLASGILFGPALGILIALSATTFSAALSLTLVRTLLGDWIRPRITHPTAVGINARLKARGWLAVTSLRMIAVVPFSVLNYTAAFTQIPLRSFALATLVGSAPGTSMTVVLGDALTGNTDPMVIPVTIILALAGITGLVVESRLPSPGCGEGLTSPGLSSDIGQGHR